MRVGQRVRVIRGGSIYEDSVGHIDKIAGEEVRVRFRDDADWFAPKHLRHEPPDWDAYDAEEE